MAKSHTNGAHTNPEVRFERTDVEIGPVVKGGAYLFLVLAVSAVLATWLAAYVTEREQPLKKTDLPPAKVDEQTSAGEGKTKEGFTQLPPEPRLEALEDMRERK